MGDGSTLTTGLPILDEGPLPTMSPATIADLRFHMLVKPRQVRFGMSKRDALPGQCRACEHVRMCRGECPRNRCVRTTDGEPGLNYLCPGFRRFYGHIREDLVAMAREIRGEDRRPAPAR